MADATPRRGRPDRRLNPTSRTRSNSLLASAAVLTASRTSLAKPEGWQDEIWEFYDNTPEVRFGVSWLSNALSRVRLYAGQWVDNADEPAPIDTSDKAEVPATQVQRDAVDLLAQLCEGPTGQSQMLGEFAAHLSLPGVGYLVGIPRPELPRDEWTVCSQTEIGTKAKPGVEGGYVWTRRTGNDERDVEELPENALVVKVWRPHKRRRWLPDSPARAQLPILRELSLLTAHVEATATSRLAGAGVILLPTELEFPTSKASAGSEDPFITELIEVMVKPISDRGSAAAVVPYPLRMPGEHIANVKHLTFATPLDEHALTLREEAIRRFATGWDLPAEVLLGVGDVNHWTAWQVEESALKLHVAPAVETIVQALTIGYLLPALIALGHSEADVANLVVWYDPSELTVRPDRSGDAKDLYDRKVIGAKALRRECGFSDDDEPSDDELEKALLLSVLDGSPSLFPVIAPLLGLGTVTVPAGAEPFPAGAPTDTGAPPPGGTPDAQGVPTTGAPPDPGAAALLAASDVLVRRAVERAGNRLLSGLKRTSGFDLTALADVPVAEVHAHLTDATQLAPLDQLLDGAWPWVPAVAERCEVDPGALTAALDGYTRGLLAGGQLHTWERLRDVLGGELVPA